MDWEFEPCITRFFWDGTGDRNVPTKMRLFDEDGKRLQLFENIHQFRRAAKNSWLHVMALRAGEFKHRGRSLRFDAAFKDILQRYPGARYKEVREKLKMLGQWWIAKFVASVMNLEPEKFDAYASALQRWGDVQERLAQDPDFVEELDEVPEDAIVIFSAHGVAKSVPAEAARRHLQYVDATCPLVSKVHREAERHHALGHHVILIGHAGHPEVVGTIGQLPKGAISLVESAEAVAALEVVEPDNLAFITQTTLSVDETVGIIGALRQRFPNIRGPAKEDI